MKVINKERYEKVVELFCSKNVNLSDNEIKIYSNVFEIISQFTHNKLTNEEIFAVYDLLSDVITNNRPDIVSHVSKEDRIRVQVKLMEELEETKGKLNLEEKTALAFCIYTGVCIQIYDEERDMMCNGIVLFDSFEHINSEFEYDKQQFPSKYNMEEKAILFDETYGYDKENPIKTVSIDASYFYLSKLRYNWVPIVYNRLGSFGNSKGETIDGYEIYLEKKSIFKKKLIKIATLYINAYCDEMPRIAPKNFTLAD